MESNRYFENEKLKDRSSYFSSLIKAMILIIALQFLLPIIKTNRYSGSMTEWIITATIIIFLITYSIFHKRLVSIAFDTSKKKITIITTTLIRGTKTNDYNFEDITIKDGKDLGTLRRSPTRFIDIYNKSKLIIKIERKSIGEYPFDNILAEFQQLEGRCLCRK